MCHGTCHFPCSIPEGGRKYNCDATINKGTSVSCNACRGNCVWNSQYNNAYRFRNYQEDDTRASDAMKACYEKARNESTSALNSAKFLTKDFEKIQMILNGMIRNALKATERLKEIVLKPDPLSGIDYIELLIESEK